MDLVTDSRALMIVGQLLDIKSSVKPILEQEAQKPKFSPAPMQKAFSRATPESQGVSSQRMADFLNALRDDATLDMHGVIVVKNGKAVRRSGDGFAGHNGHHLFPKRTLIIIRRDRFAQASDGSFWNLFKYDIVFHRIFILS